MGQVYVFKDLNPEKLEILKKKFEKFLIKNSQKNIFLIINTTQVRITCYNNGTCLLQGNEVNKAAEYIKKILHLDNYEYSKKNIIGSDEVGTGDVFGPIVVCSVLVKPEQISFLKQIGVKDSKKLSLHRINEIISHIKDKIIYSIQILSPSKYNFLYKKYGFNNIKTLLALSHNKAILELFKKHKEQAIVILDQFVSSKNYFHYLRNEKEVYKEIIFETKAESKYLSVALASILARKYFLKEMLNLSNEIGINLLLGAGVQVDEQINQIYKKNKNLIYFQKIAKCNFKNIKKYFEV